MSDPTLNPPQGQTWFSCIACDWSGYAEAEPEACPVCGGPDFIPAKPGSGVKVEGKQDG